MKKIAYVKHPVSDELKAEIIKQGYKIIDAQFAPKGEPLYGEKPKATPKAAKSEE